MCHRPIRLAVRGARRLRTQWSPGARAMTPCDAALPCRQYRLAESRSAVTACSALIVAAVGWSLVTSRWVPDWLTSPHCRATVAECQTVYEVPVGPTAERAANSLQPGDRRLDLRRSCPGDDGIGGLRFGSYRLLESAAPPSGATRGQRPRMKDTAEANARSVSAGSWRAPTSRMKACSPPR